MKNEGLERLASLFKQRDNPTIAGIIIGEVVSPPPNFRVKIFDDVIVEKDQLILGSQWDIDYTRTFEIIKAGEKASKFTDGKVKSNSTGISTTTPVCLFTGTAHPIVAINDPTHNHDLNNGSEFAAEGTIKWTNTFKVGDEVIIIPAINMDVFYVIDKAIRF